MGASNEKALVLCGGGGKGAFQIGAWKALSEYGILDSVSAISGTSVGALNSVLFALGDYDRAVRIWSAIKPNTLLPMGDLLIKAIRIANNPKDAAKRLLTEGVFSRRGLERVIDSLDLEKITESERKIFIGVSNTRLALKTEYIELNGKSPKEIKDYLLASSAIPLVYPREKIGDKEFVDGGFLSETGNAPFMPVYKAGYRDIVVVALENDFDISDMKDFLIGKVDVSNFNDCNFTVIKPLKKLGGVLDFSHETLMSNMEHGYYSAKYALKRLEESNAVTAEIPSGGKFQSVAIT